MDSKEIYCNNSACRWMEFGICQKHVIAVGQEGSCESFEKEDDHDTK